MRWKQVNNPSELTRIGNCVVALDWVDGCVKTMTLTADDGSALRIAGAYDSLTLHQPEPPKVVSMVKVTGLHVDLKMVVSKNFEDRKEAVEWAEMLKGAQVEEIQEVVP